MMVAKQSNNFDPCAAAANFPSGVQAYLAGLTFALAVSPCKDHCRATPLDMEQNWHNIAGANICNFIGNPDPVIGGSLLLTYTTGYVAPLLLAASFAGALQGLLGRHWDYAQIFLPSVGGGQIRAITDKLSATMFCSYSYTFCLSNFYCSFVSWAISNTLSAEPAFIPQILIMDQPNEMTTAIAIEDVRREVKILRALTGHNNLVQFYDAFEDHENVYIVMDFLDKGSYLLFNFNDYPNGMVTLFNLLIMGNWQAWMQFTCDLCLPS
ncbi:hypothetical protein LOK49_LG10G00583 [Camellia lanceoleosa]|uniref:Uncharacterized protein n=1 Tax=Camellia lanceoleosa TaxID=1840588 RepID=A0ACC0GAF3_9ERIC|nr:hypothetical protein LOK49_LG10G00583 [Camellia lanceoleosa]